jgi:hypothetical protein
VRALDILGQVKNGFSEDATIMGIVTAGEEICDY